MDYSKFKPLGKQVLIRRDKVEEKKFGSILLPESRYYDARWCTVLALGPGNYKNGAYIPLEIKINDRILVSSYDGDKVDPQDDRIQIITEDVIMAVLVEGCDIDMSTSDS